MPWPVGQNIHHIVVFRQSYAEARGNNMAGGIRPNEPIKLEEERILGVSLVGALQNITAAASQPNCGGRTKPKKQVFVRARNLIPHLRKCCVQLPRIMAYDSAR